jgi:hypothetical protein
VRQNSREAWSRAIGGLEIPPEWGGTNDRINLWALCEECADGRRQFWESFTPYAAQISRAIAFDEPHRRIGELLKAFEGRPAPSDLIGIVASAKEYQEDFQRRIRELRSLGWIIRATRRYNEGPRVRVYYRLLHHEPWPENIHAAIKAAENAASNLRSLRRPATTARDDLTALVLKAQSRF